jgi:16S rRNA processing protein RimM
VPRDVAKYGPLTAPDGRQFEIVSARPASGPASAMLVVRFKGVSDRNAAEALTNTRLSVPFDRLPPVEEGEFYHAEMIGLAAVTPDGTALGTVVAVQNYGAGDLLEIAPAAGPSILVPFTETAVPEVDIAGGRVVAVPPVFDDEGEGSMTFRATVLTLFPEMFPGPLGVSLAGKALADGIWSLEARDIRASATSRHRNVDDTPAGGGPGMVMRADVLAAAIDAAAPAGDVASAALDEPARAADRSTVRRRTCGWVRRCHRRRPLRRRRRTRHRGPESDRGLGRRLRAFRWRNRCDGAPRRDRPAAPRRHGQRGVGAERKLRRRAPRMSRTTPGRRSSRGARFRRFWSPATMGGSPNGGGRRLSGSRGSGGRTWSNPRLRSGAAPGRYRQARAIGVRNRPISTIRPTDGSNAP